MTGRWMLAVLLAALFAGGASAQSAREMRGEVEASMRVAGHLDIGREGEVTGYAIDRSDALPPYVTRFLDRAVPALRFEPILVDGAPVLARARMSLLLVATPAGDGDMQLSVRSAHFGDDSPDEPGIRYTDLRPPRYPANVARIGGKGTVYLLVQVARDGSVADVVAEQVNLTALGSARQMDTIRETLSRAAIETARTHWRFVPPTGPEDAARDHWVVRVPIFFSMQGDREADYGEWSAYHPGSRTRPAWAEADPPGFGPDALAAGAVHPAGSRFRLAAPLGG
ncbi:energy transducer TonB [Luteimonas sp. Y-2-2-4F]|nr:energy transducer TonB [Luteimonas sp. Y-2-2-4F]MCD9033373.1 energy transducer TonB [Luteimonas sp. Y-2-2-4F]